MVSASIPMKKIIFALMALAPLNIYPGSSAKCREDLISYLILNNILIDVY